MEPERQIVAAIYWGVLIGPILGGLFAAAGMVLYRRLDNVYSEAHKFGDPRTPWEAVKPTVIIMGVMERAFFTLVTAVAPAVAPPSMMGWLALKMLTNLNRNSVAQHIEPDDYMRRRGAKDAWDYRRRVALGGLVGGFISLAFAYVAGLVVRALWPNDWLWQGF